MADTAAASTHALPVDDALLARLHGASCITCGSTTGPMAAAGHVYTTDSENGRLGWAVVACAKHQGRQQ